MRRALELLDTDLWFPDSVVFHLTYSEDSRAYLLERFQLLNDEQLKATVAFLECIRDYQGGKDGRADSAAEALGRYWTLPVDKRPTNTILLLDG